MSGRTVPYDKVKLVIDCADRVSQTATVIADALEEVVNASDKMASTLEALAEEAQGSVEWGDWPELQRCVERAEKARAAYLKVRPQ